MDPVSLPAEPGARQDRHTATGPPRPGVAAGLPATSFTGGRRRRHLGTRFAASVAVSVAAVVLLLTLGGMRIAEGLLRGDLQETARVTAVAIADDIELRGEPMTREATLPLLREFMNAAADLYAISVFRLDNGTTLPVASTSELTPPPPALVQDALSSGEPAMTDGVPHLTIVAAPIVQDGATVGAVAVAVSMRSVEQLHGAAYAIAGGGALTAIAGITLLIHLLARRLVLRPLEAIRTTMARAGAGDLTARARVSANDELQDVADGLNAMLIELHDLHTSLNQRIAAATRELQERNQQIVRSYESVLQLRETAARAQQLAAIGQTVANVAHQIGTPLNLVSGHVQLLQREIQDPALRRRLTIVEDQVGRVATAVRDLLERARPHGKQGPVRIDAVLHRLADTTRLRLGASHVSLTVHVAPDLPTIHADETGLELALLNLITNALDAMPSGGTVALEAMPTRAGVRLTVADTGPGIPPDLLPRIFEPWVTTKGPGHGSGLGLSITRDVITNIGGTITVDSRAGDGTTFVIDLPAAHDGAPA